MRETTGKTISLGFAMLMLSVAASLFAEENGLLRLNARKQISIAESGKVNDYCAIGCSPGNYRLFRGNAVTYLEFEIPSIPGDKSISMAELVIPIDNISSKEHFLKLIVGRCEKDTVIEPINWEGRPEVVAGTESEPVEISKTGAFAVDVTNALRDLKGGSRVILYVKGYNVSGKRWIWYAQNNLPVLALTTRGVTQQALALSENENQSKSTINRPAAASALMDDWKKFETVPILSYQWPKNADEKMRAKRFEDYREMGFTGIYKLDAEQPYAGRLFLDRGMHGFMFQTRFVNRREPVLGADGKPAWFRPARASHPYSKSIFSPENAKCYYDWTTEFVKGYGLENLFSAGDTIVMTSWDETGLYSREAIEYGYTAKDEFIKYLTEHVYRDKGPGEDSDRDGRTFNSETGMDLKSWQEIQLPAITGRYEQPGLWRLWIDFHGYYTNLFFLRGGQHVSKGINRDVELFPFAHATVKWPGASSMKGLDLYGQARMHRILTVEDCQPDYPGSTIHYSFTDQLSRRYNRPVIGWSWFWPNADRQNDPLVAGRALARAMGHNVHGLLFFIYKPEWAKKPEMRSAVAYWHHTFQAHWDFLKNATVPKPQAAVLFPRNTGNMYPGYEYPKLDYGWTIQALSEAHIPFEVVADNQLESEPEILDDYKALIIPTAAWESKRFLDRIEKFIANGGFVYTDADSLMIDNGTGLTIPFLIRFFGIKPLKKYKGLFSPGYDSISEYQWASEFAAKWQSPTWEKESHGYIPDVLSSCSPLLIDDTDLKFLRDKLPTSSGTGLPQSLIDPRQPQFIMAESNSGALPDKHRTFHDIITGEAVSGAKVLASYGTEVCAVETAQTVWTGFRPGVDHACIFPLGEMRKWGEPIWPFDKFLSGNAVQRNGARQWITRIIEKAGIKAPLALTLDGKPCPWVEILIRQNPAGNAMMFLINHEMTPGDYLLSGELLNLPRVVGNLMDGKEIKPDAEGRIQVKISAGEVVLLASGDSEFVGKRILAQQKVPKKYKDMVVFE